MSRPVSTFPLIAKAISDSVHGLIIDFAAAVCKPICDKHLKNTKLYSF